MDTLHIYTKQRHPVDAADAVRAGFPAARPVRDLMPQVGVLAIGGDANVAGQHGALAAMEPVQAGQSWPEKT